MLVIGLLFLLSFINGQENSETKESVLLRLEKLEKIVKELANPNSFFLAYTQKEQKRNEPGASTIIFPEEIFDKGDEYNPTTGLFTAKKDGVYIVVVALGMSLPSGGHHWAQLRIYRNESQVAFREDWMGWPHPYFSIDLNCILSLSKGDTVWIKFGTEKIYVLDGNKSYFAISKIQ